MGAQKENLCFFLKAGEDTVEINTLMLCMELMEQVGWQMSQTHGHLPAEEEEILKKKNN